MSRNAAMVEAAQMAEENMDVFRRGLQRRIAKRRAAEQQPASRPRDEAAASEGTPALRSKG